MSKTAMMVCLGSVLSTSALADPDRNHPMQFEVGVNTRHFSAASAQNGVAFRSTTGEAPTDPAAADGTALTTSLRFTGRTSYNVFLGVEGEVGEILGIADSNVAGAYGVVGANGNLGLLRIGGELVAGGRWVRYDTPMRADPSAVIVEPRVRADLWVAPKLTIGAAAGATLGDDSVWMAGVYIGVHSFEYDRKQ